MWTCGKAVQVRRGSSPAEAEGVVFFMIEGLVEGQLFGRCPVYAACLLGIAGRGRFGGGPGQGGYLEPAGIAVGVVGVPEEF